MLKPSTPEDVYRVAGPVVCASGSRSYVAGTYEGTLIGGRGRRAGWSGICLFGRALRAKCTFFNYLCAFVSPERKVHAPTHHIQPSFISLAGPWESRQAPVNGWRDHVTI